MGWFGSKWFGPWFGPWFGYQPQEEGPPEPPIEQVIDKNPCLLLEDMSDLWYAAEDITSEYSIRNYDMESAVMVEDDMIDPFVVDEDMVVDMELIDDFNDTLVLVETELTPG